MKKGNLKEVLLMVIMCVMAISMPFVFAGCKPNDGVVTMRVEVEYVQWKYESEDNWTNLITIEDVLNKIDGGNQNNPKIEEKEVEFRKTDSYLQWRFVSSAQGEDDNWTNLVLLSEIEGMCTITYDYKYSGFGEFFNNYKEMQIIQSGTSIENLPTPTNECSGDFDGWYISGTDTKLNQSDLINDSLRLEARWNYLPSGL